MKWNFDTKRFVRTLAAYAVIIITLDTILTHYFNLTELKQSIIEIFGAIIIYQIIEEIIRQKRR